MSFISNRNVIETQFLMSLLLEDFDMSEEELRINEALRDSDDSVVDIVNVDSKTDQKAEDAAEELNDLLDVDLLIDKLESLEREQPSVIDNEEGAISITLKNSKPDTTIDLDLCASPTNTIDNSTLNVHLRDSKKNTAYRELVASDGDMIADVTVNLIDSERKVTKDYKNKDLTVTLKKKPIDTKQINVKVDSGNDSKGDNDVDPNDKFSIFIKRRDELINSNDPNLQLSVCIKTVIQLRDSLERLISHLPNENTLVKTKYLLGDILENILSNSTLLLKDEKKLKKMVYKIYGLVISLNQYIQSKFGELKERINDSSKGVEDEQISKQINDIDKAQSNKENDSNSNNDKTYTTFSTQKKPKVPNVNKKKF